MRIDDFLSTVGVIKRRTVAKELASSKLIEVGGRTIKASYNVNIGDIIVIKGSKGQSLEIISVPTGSVPKTDREKYVKMLSQPE